MASRCSGPISNCPNHRKLYLRCLFPNTTAFSLYFASSAFSPSISSKLSLPCPGMSPILSFFYLKLPHFHRKKETCTHPYFPLALPLATKKTIHSSIYPYSRNKQPTLYSCNLISILIFFFIIQLEIPIIYPSYFPTTVASVLICLFFLFFFYICIYLVSFIYTLLHCHWVMLGVLVFLPSVK